MVWSTSRGTTGVLQEEHGEHFKKSKVVKWTKRKKNNKKVSVKTIATLSDIQIRLNTK